MGAANLLSLLPGDDLVYGVTVADSSGMLVLQYVRRGLFLTPIRVDPGQLSLFEQPSNEWCQVIRRRDLIGEHRYDVDATGPGMFLHLSDHSRPRVPFEQMKDPVRNDEVVPARELEGVQVLGPCVDVHPVAGSHADELVDPRRRDVEGVHPKPASGQESSVAALAATRVQDARP